MSSSHFAPSFSSATAGKDSGTSNHAGNSSTAGGGGSSSGDWTRRVNGATTNSTSRRPSLSTTLTHPSTPLTSSSSNVYHPPHHYNRQAAAATTTYAKDELLDIFKVHESAGSVSSKIADLLHTDFGSSGTSSGGWGRGGDESTHGVEACWDKDGGQKPVSLEEMTEEDRELFSGNVNSPHKVLSNNTQGAPNNHSTPPPKRNIAVGAGITPGSSRAATRRREPSDAALSGNPFATGTPSQISRRRTDLRDGDEGGSPIRERTFFGRWGSTAGTTGDDESKEKDEGTGGTIGRNTGLFRRGSTAATWGATGSGSALNSPMGAFGNGAFGGGPMGGFALQPGDKAKVTGAKGNPNSAQSKAEDLHEQAEDSHQKPNFDATYDDERERPLTSDTDPYGVDAGDDRHSSHNDRNSPLPTPGIHDQQRIKASPFGPGAGISISTSNNPRVSSQLGTPTKTRGDLAYQTFGGSREGVGGMGNLGMTGLHNQLQNLSFNQQGQVPLRRSREGSIGNALAGDNEPLSPAETNPFQSPPPEKVDDDGMMNDHNEGGGLGSVIAGLRRGEGHIGAPGSDRSGRSSTAGLGSVGGGLSGFGGMTGPGLWSSGQSVVTPGGIGSSSTPGSFFAGAGLSELTSPAGSLGGGSLLSGGLGGVVLGGSSHFGSASRASRLGQLFPENQQHQDDGPGGFEQSDTFTGDSRFNAFGGRRGFGSITDSPMRERGEVSDLFGFPSARSLSSLAGTAAAQDNPVFQRDDSLGGLPQPHQAQEPSLQNPGQPLKPPPGTLAPQPQHVMVMPDKIQWVYRDPSGVVQGPFSGLEMHEWYRAGFFTSDLAVKRQEDTEFEQLGNLVRKIGNTREPFLVPLPGSSAGMSTNAAANWPGSWLNEMPGAQQPPPSQPVQTPGSVQPPFAGSFPTFGTTLTAEQQNALERRKQEEQYLMAKQREFLLQQQMMAKQAAVAQQLHHQSSTQSLHSQPSFGSLHSPGSFAPTAAPAATAAAIIGGQNAFEPGALLRQAGAAAGGVGGMDIGAQLGLTQSFQPPIAPALQPQDPGLMMQQQQQKFAEQQRQQLQKSYQTQQTQHAEKQALQEAQEQAQQVAAQLQQLQFNQPTEESAQKQAAAQEQQPPSPQKQELEPAAPTAKVPAPEQLAVNIPKALSQKPSPAPTSKPTSLVWGGHHAQPAPLVQPFPPPPLREASPTSLMTRSPSVDAPSAPSIAPWAKEADQAVKTTSLREIQELEAKQAAVREAAEAQARREALSQQVANQPPLPAPGLPSTATWATSPSTTPNTSTSAWNKPLAKAAPVVAGRKTLQQIQKEEEARKAKAVAAAASQAAMNSSNPVISAAGKRYADLASKTAAAQNPMTNSAWTTVGPGGKSKGPIIPTPASAVPTAPTQSLRPSTSLIGLGPAAAVKRPPQATAPIKPATTSAQEEFLKWCRASIKGLNSGVSSDQVIETVGNFPSDAEIIADTIYAVSTTMDGRRWAEEYIKRRNAAGSGVVIEAGTTPGANSGGWNEVAKTRPAVQTPAASGVPETSSAFRVVAGKKKGGRR